MVSTLDICWVAGFLEGEGSFQNVRSPIVAVAQVQREPLERLQRLFGGKILYSIPKNKPNSQPIHNWS